MRFKNWEVTVIEYVIICLMAGLAGYGLAALVWKVVGL